MTAQQIQNTGSGCLSRASSRNGNAKASRELAMNQTYMALTGLLMYRVAANEVCTRHMNAEMVIITAVHHTRVRTATVSSSDVVAGSDPPARGWGEKSFMAATLRGQVFPRHRTRVHSYLPERAIGNERSSTDANVRTPIAWMVHNSPRSRRRMLCRTVSRGRRPHRVPPKEPRSAVS